MAHYTAVVLAGGAGKRMNSRIHKQYLLLRGKPVLYYSLKAFEESPVSDIVLVVGAGEVDYCRKKIIGKYGIAKVIAVVEGGKERYHSVFEGLKASDGADFVLIHDGARPFVDQEIICRSMEAVTVHEACAAGMPVKDTIKIADNAGFAKETPDRNLVWQIQTPQTFSYPLIRDAYEKMFLEQDCSVTDDAMVLERMTGHPVKLIEGSYRNIKITTQEDLSVAENYMDLQ